MTEPQASMVVCNTRVISGVYRIKKIKKRIIFAKTLYYKLVNTHVRKRRVIALRGGLN
jgi:hypothetical protein